MDFQGKCPHCAHAETHQIDEVALRGLASDRVMPVECGNCSARFCLDLVVRTRPLADFLTTEQLLSVRAHGRLVAAQVQRALKAKARPEISCAACRRRFGGRTGYPESLARDGLCAVDSQSIRRRLSARRRSK